MDNPGVQSDLWAALDGRLWHATSPEGLSGIARDGEIRILPDRYKGSFSKTLRSVSLMDFGPTATNRPRQIHNWLGWLGHQQKCRVAVWIEINREAVSINLLHAEASRLLWDQDGSRSRMFIPGVEACHRGPIPITAFVSLLCVDSCDHSIFRSYAMADTTGCVAVFEATLPPEPPEGPISAAMRKGRERVERALEDKKRDEQP